MLWAGSSNGSSSNDNGGGNDNNKPKKRKTAHVHRKAGRIRMNEQEKEANHLNAERNCARCYMYRTYVASVHCGLSDSNQSQLNSTTNATEIYTVWRSEQCFSRCASECEESECADKTNQRQHVCSIRIVTSKWCDCERKFKCATNLYWIIAVRLVNARAPPTLSFKSLNRVEGNDYVNEFRLSRVQFNHSNIKTFIAHN